jgi:hypothetical protein
MERYGDYVVIVESKALRGRVSAADSLSNSCSSNGEKFPAAILLPGSRCHKSRSDCVLLDPVLLLKPVNGDSEDFWVFSIVHDDPDLPTYEERVTTFGTYEQCVEACVPIVEGMLIAGVKAGRVES